MAHNKYVEKIVINNTDDSKELRDISIDSDHVRVNNNVDLTTQLSLMTTEEATIKTKIETIENEKIIDRVSTLENIKISSVDRKGIKIKEVMPISESEYFSLSEYEDGVLYLVYFDNE